MLSESALLFYLVIILIKCSNVENLSGILTHIYIAFVNYDV